MEDDFCFACLNIRKIYSRKASFICSHCGWLYLQKRYLNQHIRSSNMNQKISGCNKRGKSFTRSTDLQKSRRTCIGSPAVVVPKVAAPAAKRRRTGHGVAERLQFKLEKTRESLEGNVHQFTVDMKEAKSLSTLKKTIAVFKPVMTDYRQKHSGYKFLLIM